MSLSASSRPTDLEIEIPPRPEYVAVARHVVGALVRMGDLDPEIVEDVKLAVSEACTNAVTLSGRAGSTEPILVRGELDGKRIHLFVADRGSPIDISGQERSDSDSQEFSFERGLSLPLLQGLVEELEVVPREGGGNVLRMLISSQGEHPAG